MSGEAQTPSEAMDVVKNLFSQHYLLNFINNISDVLMIL